MKGNKKETDYKKALQQIALHFEYCDLTYDGSPCVETVPECACCGMSLPEGEDEPGAHRCNCLRSLMCRECNEMCQASRDGNLDCCEEAK